jgi:hypothetical protein
MVAVVAVVVTVVTAVARSVQAVLGGSVSAPALRLKFGVQFEER